MLDTEYRKFFDIKKVADEIEGYLPGFDRARFLEAFDFAARAHSGQMRKDMKTPYIAHPVAALKVLTSLHADEDSLISCLLHDVPEDTEYTIEDIEGRFGKRVAFLVDGITKLSKVQYKQNMPSRQVGSLKKLLLHSAKDLRVLLIKLADRLHNMKTLDNIKKAEKRLRIATETLEIYVPIANLLGIREIKSKLEDLCFKYMFPTEYAKIRDKILEGEKKRKELMEDFKKELRKIAKREGVQLRIEERTKNFYSIFKHLKDDGKDIEDIDNRIGVRMITASSSDCYRLLGAVHHHFQPVITKFKDYIANPKPNGYKSLHTTVFGVKGTLAEVHIRTEEMHIEAEYGIAAHFFDKERLKEDLENIFWSDADNSQWIKKVSELTIANDSSQEFINNLKEDILQERIIVLTRKGIPVDLPKGATGIDYAFVVNPKLALRIIGVDINGERRSITAELKTQEVIRLVVSNEKTVDLSWLNFAHTKEAKQGIIEHFKESRPDTQFVKGRQLLQQELDLENLGLIESLSFRKIRKMIQQRYGEDFDSLRNLLIAIGSGEFQARKVAQALKRRTLFTKNDCEKVTIKVTANDRFGLSKDIYETVYRYADDVTLFKGWFSTVRKKAFFVICVSLSTEAKMSRLFDELKQIQSVEMVYRTSPMVAKMIILMGLVVGAVWLGHPLLLRQLTESEVYHNNPELLDMGINLALLLMFAMIMVATNLIDKYFPSIRAKKRVGVAIFILPMVVLGSLAWEMAYFELKINWTVIALESLFAYSYWLYYYSKGRTSLRT